MNFPTESVTRLNSILDGIDTRSLCEQYMSVTAMYYGGRFCTLDESDHEILGWTMDILLFEMLRRGDEKK